MITYKAIIQYFDVIADRHQQIQSFTYGEIDLFDKDKFTEYPALHLTPTGTSIDDQTITYGFDVVVFDRYNVASNKMRNEATCLSDALLILQDLCKELTEGKYFINEDTNISMQLPILATPFIDTEPDNCSGWATSFEVITPNESTACNIPYFNTEQQFSLDYILPDGVFPFLAWYSREQIHSFTTIIANQVTELRPVVDTLIGNDALNKTGQNVLWSPVKNGFRFLDTSFTETCSLSHIPTNETENTFIITIKDFGRFSDGTSPNVIGFFGDVETFSEGLNIFINSSGEIQVTNIATTNFIKSPFPICPTNGTNSSTQHKRKEPYTFAIRVFPTGVQLYYNMNESVVLLNESIDIANKKFGLGSPTQVNKCDFILNEYVYTNNLAGGNLAKTMEWMNYR